MPPGHNDQVTRSVHLYLRQSKFEFFRNDLVGIRKPLPVGKLRSIVEHDDFEADHFADLGDEEGDMPSPKDVCAGVWNDGLDINIHDAPADHSRVFGLFSGQIEMNGSGFLLFDDFHGFLPDFRFETPPTDGSEDFPIFLDQHLGADFSRRGPFCADDGGYGCVLPFFSFSDHQKNQTYPLPERVALVSEQKASKSVRDTA
jgi:hypothetical protein